MEDARLAALIDELSAASDRFRVLWERHDVELAAHPTRTFHHPVVGSLELKTETFTITGGIVRCWLSITPRREAFRNKLWRASRG